MVQKWTNPVATIRKNFLPDESMLKNGILYVVSVIGFAPSSILLNYFSVVLAFFPHDHGGGEDDAPCHAYLVNFEV